MQIFVNLIEIQKISEIWLIMDFPGISWNMNCIYSTWNCKERCNSHSSGIFSQQQDQSSSGIPVPSNSGVKFGDDWMLDFSMFIWKYSAHMWYYLNLKIWVKQQQKKKQILETDNVANSGVWFLTAV